MRGERPQQLPRPDPAEAANGMMESPKHTQQSTRHDPSRSSTLSAPAAGLPALLGALYDG
jgi:hypothetical protein